MNSPKITVWCVMSAEEIVGPFFFEDPTVDSDDYLDILKTYFYPFLQKKSTRKIFFQQDGAPVHFAKAVRCWLNDAFDERWVGRGEAISWAPSSPDMTPLDFFPLGLHQRQHLPDACTRSR